MRDIDEIIKELVNHPDYVYSNIWTVDDCISWQLENFANDMCFEEEQEFVELVEDLDVEDIKEYLKGDSLKEAKFIWSESMDDWNSRAWEYVGCDYFPPLTESEFYNGMIRDLKIKKVLKDGNK